MIDKFQEDVDGSTLPERAIACPAVQYDVAFSEPRFHHTIFLATHAMYVQVTEADIDKYHQEYRGSEEEIVDLLKLYERFRGDMDQVCGCTLLSSARVASYISKDMKGLPQSSLPYCMACNVPGMS